MAEMQTPAAGTPVLDPPGTQTPAKGRPSGAPPAGKKKKGSKKMVKRIIAIVVAVAVIAGIAFGMWRFLFSEPKQEILRDTVTYGSISNPVEGYGVTKALNSATITLTTKGTVQEVFVSEGDFVTEGTPLYTIDSTDAYAAMEEAQKTVRNYEKQLQAIYDSYEDLTVRPAFNGKLLLAEGTEDLAVGNDISPSTKLATLVDDSKMKLTLYFNYTYENDIYVGQTARVSIPASMSQPTGTVEQINKVRYITPEGAVCFQVVIGVDNPGTLTADMGATAILAGASGEDIYAYDSGKLEYNRTADITTKVGGEILSINLINYADVTTGDVLMTISGEDNEEQIASLENQLKTAKENLTKAQENLVTESIPTFAYQYMAMNTSRAYLSQEVRQAISLAINRQVLVDQLMMGEARVAIGPLPEDHQYFNENLLPIEYDPEKAAQMLEDAGWDPNQELEMLVSTGNEIREKSAVLIQQDLAKIGIKTRIQTLDFPTLLNNAREGNYDLCFIGSAGSVDPSESVPNVTVGYMNNFAQLTDPTIGQVGESGAKEITFEARKAIYDEYQMLLKEQMPMAFLYFTNTLFAYNNRLSNVPASTTDYNINKNVWEWKVA